MPVALGREELFNHVLALDALDLREGEPEHGKGISHTNLFAMEGKGGDITFSLEAFVSAKKHAFRTYGKMDGQRSRRHEPTVVARFGNGVRLVKEGEHVLLKETGLLHRCLPSLPVRFKERKPKEQLLDINLIAEKWLNSRQQQGT